jgi:hypothetical protein
MKKIKKLDLADPKELDTTIDLINKILLEIKKLEKL